MSCCSKAKKAHLRRSQNRANVVNIKRSCEKDRAQVLPEQKQENFFFDDLDD